MDEAAFDTLYAGSVRRLIGQLYAMTGDLPEAQDCVQEAFSRAWQHRSRLLLDGNPEGWVRTTAWRIAISRWRRVTAGARAHRLHGLPADVTQPAPLDPDLADALRTLVPEQRRALVLFYLCDLPVETIAQETGIRPGTVRVQLTRGRAALALALREHEHATGRNGTATEAPHV